MDLNWKCGLKSKDGTESKNGPRYKNGPILAYLMDFCPLKM